MLRSRGTFLIRQFQHDGGGLIIPPHNNLMTKLETPQRAGDPGGIEPNITKPLQVDPSRDLLPGMKAEMIQRIDRDPAEPRSSKARIRIVGQPVRAGCMTRGRHDAGNGAGRIIIIHFFIPAAGNFGYIGAGGVPDGPHQARRACTAGTFIRCCRALPAAIPHHGDPSSDNRRDRGHHPDRPL